MSSSKSLAEYLIESAKILNSQNNSQGSTKMIECEIEKVLDEARGIYSVKYLSNRFEVYSNNVALSYKKGDKVYVLIPDGDFNKTKIIIGTSSANTSTGASLDNSNILKYTDYSENLLNSCDVISLCSYKDNDTKIANDLFNRNGISFKETFKNILTKYRTFRLSCKVRTELNKEQRTNGVYGVSLKIPVKKSVYYQAYEERRNLISSNPDLSAEEKQKQLDELKKEYEAAHPNPENYRVYELDSSIMVGSVYNFENFQYQELIFSLDRLNDIFDDIDQDGLLEIACYSKNFPSSSANKPDDIFFTDIQLKSVIEYDQEKAQNGYILSLASKDTTFFAPGYQNEKTLYPTLRVNNKETDITNFACYWFVKDNNITYKSPEYYSIGGNGWKLLNKRADSTTSTDGSQSAAGDLITNVHELKVNIDDVETSSVYKCIIEYDTNSFIEDTITIDNFYSKSEISLLTNSSVVAEGMAHYEKGGGDAVITCQVLFTPTQEQSSGNMGYSWKKKNMITGLESTDFFAFDKVETKTEAIENDKEGRLRYTQKIIIPNGVISAFDEISCTASFTYTDKSGQAKVISIGTPTINIGITPSQNGFYLSLNNGDRVYKYDMKGKSPVEGKYSTSVANTIEPITYQMFKSNGSEFSAEEYDAAAAKTIWEIDKNSLFVIDESLISETTDDKYIVKGRSLTYKIASEFDSEKQNGQILLKVNYGDNGDNEYCYTATPNIKFLKDGANGTNGSNYTAIIRYLPLIDYNVDSTNGEVIDIASATIDTKGVAYEELNDKGIKQKLKMVYINNKVEKQENGLYVDREIDYAEAASRWKIHDLENNRLISPYSAHPMFMVQVYNGAIPLDSDQFTVKWSMRGDDFNSAEMPNYITFEPVVYEGDDNSLVGLNGEKTNGTCFLRIRHIKGRRVVGSVEYKKDENGKFIYDANGKLVIDTDKTKYEDYDFGASWTNPERIITNILKADIEVTPKTDNNNTTPEQANTKQFIHAFYPIETTYVYDENASYSKIEGDDKYNVALSSLTGFAVPSLEDGYSEVVYGADGSEPAYNSVAPFNCRIYNFGKNDTSAQEEKQFGYEWGAGAGIKIDQDKVKDLPAYKTITVPDSQLSNNGTVAPYVKVRLTKDSRDLELSMNQSHQKALAVDGNRKYWGSLVSSVPIDGSNTNAFLESWLKTYYYNQWKKQIVSYQSFLKIRVDVYNLLIGKLTTKLKEINEYYSVAYTEFLADFNNQLNEIDKQIDRVSNQDEDIIIDFKNAEKQLNSFISNNEDILIEYLKKDDEDTLTQEVIIERIKDYQNNKHLIFEVGNEKDYEKERDKQYLLDKGNQYIKDYEDSKRRKEDANFEKQDELKALNKHKDNIKAKLDAGIAEYEKNPIPEVALAKEEEQLDVIKKLVDIYVNLLYNEEYISSGDYDSLVSNYDNWLDDILSIREGSLDKPGLNYDHSALFYPGYFGTRQKDQFEIKCAEYLSMISTYDGVYSLFTDGIEKENYTNAILGLRELYLEFKAFGDMLNNNYAKNLIDLNFVKDKNEVRKYMGINNAFMDLSRKYYTYTYNENDIDKTEDVYEYSPISNYVQGSLCLVGDKIYKYVNENPWISADFKANEVPIVTGVEPYDGKKAYTIGDYCSTPSATEGGTPQLWQCIESIPASEEERLFDSSKWEIPKIIYWTAVATIDDTTKIQIKEDKGLISKFLTEDAVSSDQLVQIIEDGLNRISIFANPSKDEFIGCIPKSSTITEISDKYYASENEYAKYEQEVETSRTMIKAKGFEIVHIKPILFINDTAEMGYLQGWDGDRVYTGDDDEFIASPIVAAGEKSKANDGSSGFTGIIIGTMASSVKKQNRVGLFAKHYDKEKAKSIETVFIDSKTGRATFGAGDMGKIVIDPSNGNEAIISSGAHPRYKNLQGFYVENQTLSGSIVKGKIKPNDKEILLYGESSNGFSKGDLCKYNDDIYKCISEEKIIDKTTPFNIEQWELWKSDYETKTETASDYAPYYYQATIINETMDVDKLPFYQINTNYSINTVVKYDRGSTGSYKAYRCIREINADSGDAYNQFIDSYWAEVFIPEFVSLYDEDAAYQVGDFVRHIEYANQLTREDGVTKFYLCKKNIPKKADRDPEDTTTDYSLKSSLLWDETSFYNKNAHIDMDEGTSAYRLLAKIGAIKVDTFGEQRKSVSSSWDSQMFLYPLYDEANSYFTYIPNAPNPDYDASKALSDSNTKYLPGWYRKGMLIDLTNNKIEFASGLYSLDATGTMQAAYGNFTGEIHATAGSIEGSFNVNGSLIGGTIIGGELYSSNYFTVENDKFSSRNENGDGVCFQLKEGWIAWNKRIKEDSPFYDGRKPDPNNRELCIDLETKNSVFAVTPDGKVYSSKGEFRDGEIKAGTIHGGTISGSFISGGSININPTGTFSFIVNGTKDTTGNGNIENLTGKMEVKAKNSTFTFAEYSGLSIDIQGSTIFKLTESQFFAKSGDSSILCSGDNVIIKGGNSNITCNGSGVVLTSAGNGAKITLTNGITIESILDDVTIKGGMSTITCNSSGITANCNIEAQSIYSLTQYKIRIATKKNPDGKTFSALAAASDDSSEREAVAVGLIPLDNYDNPNLNWEYGGGDEVAPDGGFIKFKYYDSSGKKVHCFINAEQTRVKGKFLVSDRAYFSKGLDEIFVNVGDLKVGDSGMSEKKMSDAITELAKAAAKVAINGSTVYQATATGNVPIGWVVC